MEIMDLLEDLANWIGWPIVLIPKKAIIIRCSIDMGINPEN